MTNPLTPEANVTTQIIIDALYILASDIQSDDGVAQACLMQAIRRMEQLETHVKILRHYMDVIQKGDVSIFDGISMTFSTSESHAQKIATQALQDTNHYNA